MDSLLSRQREIIIYLIDKIDYTPVKNIAENMRVSEKTVYRELKMIEKYLEEKCIYLEKRPGTGVKLNVTEEQKMKLNFDIRNDKSNIIDYISTDARRQKILSDLLSNSPKTYSVQKLSEKYFISRASIVNDFKYIENYIKKYNLKLEKSKEGTKLIGSEINIRKTMVSLINELIVINSNKNSDFQSERIDNQTLDELFHQFGKNDVNIIKEILKDIEIKMNYVMGEVYYINLITHLLILIKRLRSGNKIYEDNKSDSMKITNEKVYQISIEVSIKISEIFEIFIPKEETYFIYQYLISSGLGINKLNIQERELLVDKSPQVIEIAEEIIKSVSEIIQFELKTDNQLYENLIIHLRAMINRLKYNIVIKNPILDDIKKEFPAIYGLVNLVILNISEKYNINDISPDEIAYLTLYFQAAVEQNMDQKRVLVVCSSGVGSSHLLKGRIKYSFPKWDIADVISSSSLRNGYNLENIDLIISTVKVDAADVSIAYVTALFNETDVRTVTEIYVKNALKNRKNDFSFNIIGKFLDKKYIHIENEIFSEKTKANNILNIMINENYIEKRNIKNNILETHINERFSVYLIKKRIVKKTCIGLRIKNNSLNEYKLEIILAVTENNEVNRHLLREVFELYNNEKLLENICNCKNINEIAELIKLS